MYLIRVNARKFSRHAMKLKCKSVYLLKVWCSDEGRTSYFYVINTKNICSTSTFIYI